MTQPVMLITGASRGIGAATALLAAQRGYAVCVNYLHNEAKAQAVVAQISRSGGRALAVRADVAQEEQVEQLFAAVDDQLGPVAALVNNAGILAQQSRVEDMTAQRITQVMQTNVVSCFLCARAAIRRMSTRHGGNGGTMVNVSSVAARLGAAGEYVDYAASKAAIDAFTIGLAQEVAPEGIRVNAVRPGFIYTDIHASGGEPGRVDRIKGNLPLRRGGTPEEVAQAILWLCGPESSYSTGAFIDVCGGK